MGFLDFLKKEMTKPDAAPKAVAPLPPPKPDLPPLPQDPTQLDWNEPFKNSLPQDNAPAQGDDYNTDDVPVPPQQQSDFLQSAANTLKPTKDEFLAVEPKAEAPPLPSLDLPDFTDEDLAALEKPDQSHWAASAEQPEQPKPVPAPAWQPQEWPKVEVKSEEPVLPPPVNAVALPEEELKLPTGETTSIEQLEPAKFLSSGSYFMILGENKAIRRAIRQSDEVIKDAVLRHEQLDLQHKRVAADINAVQELFIKIDGALFE